MRIVISTLTLLAWLVAACGSGQPVSRGITPPEYESTAVAASQLGRQATNSTVSALAQQQANAAIRAMGIAAAAEGTRSALESQVFSLNTQGTEQAMGLFAEGTQAAISLTADAATSTATYNEQVTVQELRQQEQDREQQAQEFARKQNSKVVSSVASYTIVTLFVAGVTLIAVLLAWAYLQKQRRPIFTAVTPLGNEFAVAPTGWMEIPSIGRIVDQPPARPLLLAGPTNGHRRGIPLPTLKDCHVMVVGAQGDGKSNTLKDLSLQRLGVTALDLHYRPGTWPPHVEVISDPPKIAEALREMGTVLQQRIQDGHGGAYNHPNRTIVVDELPAMANNKDIGPMVWDAFRQWLYEARKYNLYLILGTHTPHVKPLGLEGQSAVLEQIKATIFLGSWAIKKDRAAVEGMARPALLQIEQQDPKPLIIPYHPRLDPESAGFTPPRVHQRTQAEVDAGAFNTAPLGELTSRNKAALYLFGRSNGRASGGEYDRLDTALRYRVEHTNCQWSRGLIGQA